MNDQAWKTVYRPRPIIGTAVLAALGAVPLVVLLAHPPDSLVLTVAIAMFPVLFPIFFWLQFSNWYIAISPDDKMYFCSRRPRRELAVSDVRQVVWFSWKLVVVGGSRRRPIMDIPLLGLSRHEKDEIRQGLLRETERKQGPRASATTDNP